MISAMRIAAWLVVVGRQCYMMRLAGIMMILCVRAGVWLVTGLGGWCGNIFCMCPYAQKIPGAMCFGNFLVGVLFGHVWELARGVRGVVPAHGWLLWS